MLHRDRLVNLFCVVPSRNLMGPSDQTELLMKITQCVQKLDDG